MSDVPLRELSVNSPKPELTRLAKQSSSPDPALNESYEIWAVLKRIDELFVLISKIVSASRAATMLAPQQHASAVGKEYARTILSGAMREIDTLEATEAPDYGPILDALVERVKVPGTLRDRLIHYQSAYPEQMQRLVEAFAGLQHAMNAQRVGYQQQAASGL